MFGRAREEPADLHDLPPIEPRRPVGDRRRSVDTGPFDSEEPGAREVEGGLDFGSLRVPMPARAQLQVEHGSGELLRAVHVLMSSGRVSLSALAAPRSTPLWRELSQEIADSLAKDGARVRSEWGEWGREVQAGSHGALSRFIGVDGPRWMLYGVATGPAEGAEELAEALREMIRGTVVTRGADPLPVKTVLPLRLPEHLEERVEQAREHARRPAEVPSVPVHPPGWPNPAGPSVPPARPGPSSPTRPVPPPAPPPRQPSLPSRSARTGWPGNPVSPGRAVPPGGTPRTRPPAAPAAANAGMPSSSVPPAGSSGWSSERPQSPPPSRFDGPSTVASTGGSRTGRPPGHRRPGLPPIPAATSRDSSGVSTPPADATWTFARPVVSADQVAQQPAWAQLSDAPAFWPERTRARPPGYPPSPPERGGGERGQAPPGLGEPVPPVPGAPSSVPEHGARRHGRHGQPPAPRDFPPPPGSAASGPRHRPPPPAPAPDTTAPEPRRGREPRHGQRSSIDSTDALHTVLTSDSAVTRDRRPRVERRGRHRPS